MGREIRRVPPNWEHPKKMYPDHRSARMVEGYRPLYDRDAQSAWVEWMEEYTAWLGGEFARVMTEYPENEYNINEPYPAFCEWHGQPPDPEYYRPRWTEGEATAYQVYETVSEGTPISPVFLTREELIDWLVNDGSGMGIGGDSKKMSRPAAERFVGAGSAPSMIVDGRGIRSGVEAFED